MRRIVALLFAALLAGTFTFAATAHAASGHSDFAFTLSNGYGIKDPFSNDPAEFERLLVSMKQAGFNTIHCNHRDWRVELCRKHGVRMMIDVLAWGEGVEQDIRRPAQRDSVKAVCEKVRNDEAVWGYNLWNETLSHFGRPDGKSIDDYIVMLREWDPTHPIWVGTYRNYYANALKQKPGVHGYYDYAWQRGFNWHFPDLQWFQRHVPSQDGYIGRWIQGSNYNGDLFSLNTSIAFGLKTVIWFIGGPFTKAGDFDPKHRYQHLATIGREMQNLYPEIGKIGRPSHVFSTPTLKTHDNKDKTNSVPWNLTPFPTSHWMQVTGGEAVAGFFRYPSGDDAVFFANHNAYAAQQIVIALGPEKTSIELFDRETGRWTLLEGKDDRYAFTIRAAGGELLRVRGRSQP